MYDGSDVQALGLPDLKVFVENEYKSYEIPDISVDRIQKICAFNSFGNDESKK